MTRPLKPAQYMKRWLKNIENTPGSAFFSVTWLSNLRALLDEHDTCGSSKRLGFFRLPVLPKLDPDKAVWKKLHKDFFTYSDPEEPKAPVGSITRVKNSRVELWRWDVVFGPHTISHLSGFVPTERKARQSVVTAMRVLAGSRRFDFYSPRQA